MFLGILAIAVALLSAAFTAWYALETRRMRHENKVFADEQIRQAKASSDAAERSAKAAETSAKAAEESSRISTEGMQLAQRAYLVPEKIAFVSGVPSVNQVLVTSCILRNTGNSPALNVRVEDKMEIRNPVNSQAPLLYPDTKRPGLDIGPGTELKREYSLHGTSAQVTQHQASAIQNDTMRLYVYGWARYNDIFGREHWTKWCYEYSRGSRTASFEVVPAYHKMEQ
jgi:hypothetical protein